MTSSLAHVHTLTPSSQPPRAPPAPRPRSRPRTPTPTTPTWNGPRRRRGRASRTRRRATLPARQRRPARRWPPRPRPRRSRRPRRAPSQRFLSEARTVDEVVWHKRRFVRSSPEVTERPDGPLRQVVHAAVVLITSSDIDNVRECSEKTCRWLFLDRSRNHSRRWCDMQLCGNRSKAKRFYARTRNDV